MKKWNMLIALLLSTTLLFAQTSASKPPVQTAGKMEAEKVELAQPKQVVQPTKMDTVTTLCLVLTNVQQGASTTMWLTKIHGVIFDFPMPTASNVKGDSLTLKKQWLPVKNYYTFIEEEVIDPKTKKKVKQQKVQQIPGDLILIDFNNNYPRKNGR